MARRMTAYQARDIIARHDPERARRCNEVDPLPLYCHCDNPRDIEVTTLADADEVFWCGACSRYIKPIPSIRQERVLK